ncbi:MAG: 8-amino-7-oxononanoate synthase [bacterium]
MSRKFIEEELSSRRENNLYRKINTYSPGEGYVEKDGQKILNLSANNYLDLIGHPKVKKYYEQALEKYGTGSGASRLVTGSRPVHDKLEEKLVEHKNYQTALLFGSGYLVNMGVIPAVVGRNDYVVADRLAHASLIDGILASRANFYRYKHNNIDDLARRLENIPDDKNCLVVTESVFSMDGDLAPLEKICRLVKEHEALLLVDEAHATGVFGPCGAGLVAESGLEDLVDFTVITLSKALGGYGGAVACTARMKEFLVNKARSFIYSTAPAPPVAGSALGALRVLDEQPELGQKLQRCAKRFRDKLREAGLSTGDSESQIIPVIVGESERTLEFSEKLEEKGLLGVPIRPPTVPEGTARVRFSVSLAHSEKEIYEAADKIIEAALELGII